MVKVTDATAVHELSEEWRRSGVRAGDMLLLHSSTGRTLRKLKRLGFKPDIETILDSFLEAVGGNGTLLLPLFNFDFGSGVAFDIRTTPSRMGALTEAARARGEVVRTGHPMYSFAALGNAREHFRGLKNFGGYGADSPFAMLHRMSGKIAVLDLPDRDSMTFYHYVEESMSVNYRFHKEFSGLYTDFDGNACNRTYGLFVRKIDEGVVTHVDPMGEMLWAKGLYSGDRPGNGSGLRTVDAAQLFEEVARVIGEGKARGLLYEIQ